MKELNETKIHLLQRAQQDTYPEKFNKLLHNKDIDKASKIIALNPTFNDKQLICVRGRFQVSDIFTNSNHQIIISRHHPTAKLIIKHHKQYLHVGRDQTLSSICSRFWIPASCGLICSVIKHCLYCKQEKAAPVTPFMANVLLDRLCFNEKPFTKTGVDYLGPYQIKLSKGTRSNQATTKCYIVLFTCLSTRAVHLEIAEDLPTDSFVYSLRRFLARRGTVKS